MVAEPGGSGLLTSLSDVARGEARAAASAAINSRLLKAGQTASAAVLHLLE